MVAMWRCFALGAVFALLLASAASVSLEAKSGNQALVDWDGTVTSLMTSLLEESPEHEEGGHEKEEELPDTAWESRPNPFKTPKQQEPFPDADYGVDDGNKRDNTRKPAKDFEDAKKAAKQKATANAMKVQSLYQKIAKQQALIKKMSSKKFAAKLAASLRKKIKCCQKLAGVKAKEAVKKAAANATAAVAAAFVELQEVLTNPAQVKTGTNPTKKGKTNSQTTPKEEQETVLGDVVAMLPESFHVLPIAIMTDGERTYPVSVNKAGPHLLTKVGCRVAIKGQPIETADGDMAISVQGFKVLGAAVA